MCIPHQKPARAETREIRGAKSEKKHIDFNREGLEHGDKDFKDERKVKVETLKKEKGFFDKLFS